MPKQPTVFSLLDRAKLTIEEVKTLGFAMDDLNEYCKSTLMSVDIHSRKMEIIKMENELSKQMTPDFLTTYKDCLCKNEETKTTTRERLKVVEKFQEMLKEVIT